MTIQYPEYLIAFNSPPAGSLAYRYWGFTHRIRTDELPFEVRAVLRSSTGATRRTSAPNVKARLIVLRGRDQEIVAAGEWQEWSHVSSYRMVIDEDLRDGLEPLVLSAEVEDEWAETVHVISRPFFMGSPTVPYDEPRYLAVGSHLITNSSYRFQGLGYVWYPGRFVEPTSYGYQHLPGTQWTYDDKPEDFYYQDLVGGAHNNTYRPEFVRGPNRDHRTGFVPADFVDTDMGWTTYRRGDSHYPQGLRTGLHRDGPRCIGEVGVPCSGFVEDDEGSVVASALGRIVKVSVHGDVETIVGHRIKEGAVQPMGGGWRALDYWRGPDERNEHFEFVGTQLEGTVWEHIWDVIPDPNDSDVLYVANVDGHRIDRVRRSTQDIDVFVGDPEGEAGHVDAAGHEARFNKPRGMAIKDGVMYIGDALNYAIRAVDMQAKEVSTVVESAAKPHHHHFSGFSAVRDWATDGAFGEAQFMHPQHVRFTSDGHLLTPMHHHGELYDFDLENRTCKKLTRLPVDKWHQQHLSWHTLWVDDGETGPLDTIYYAAWDARTSRCYNRDGERVGPFADYGVNHESRPRDRCSHDGHGGQWAMNTYPQAQWTGKGAIWHAGFRGGGIYRTTKNAHRVIKANPSTFQHGERVWAVRPSNWQPSLSLMHGCHGMNKYGLETIDDLALKSKEELAQWLSDTYDRELESDDLDALYHFIRHTSITGKGLALDVEPPDDEDEDAPPDDEDDDITPPDDEDDEPDDIDDPDDPELVHLEQAEELMERALHHIREAQES